MKHIKSVQCICGRTHDSIPKDARFQDFQGIAILEWHCVCERSIGIDASLAEESEIIRILDHASFKCAMHILRLANIRTLVDNVA